MVKKISLLMNQRRVYFAYILKLDFGMGDFVVIQPCE